MNMSTCKRCGDAVSKRASLYLESFGGRVCRKHTEIFEEIEQKEKDAAAKLLEDMRKFREEQLASAIKYVVASTILVIQYFAYRNKKTLTDTAWEVFEFTFGGLPPISLAKVTRQILEQIKDLTPLTAADIPEASIDAKLQAISFGSIFRVQALRQGSCITEIYHSVREKLEKNGNYTPEMSFLLVEAYYDAMQLGELTAEELAVSMAMVADLNRAEMPKKVV